MNQPKKKPNKRAPQPPAIIRHYEALTPEETEGVVESVAELIVNFVKKRGAVPEAKGSGTDSQVSTEALGNPPSGEEKGGR
jgi:hypothetical protein